MPHTSGTVKSTGAPSARLGIREGEPTDDDDESSRVSARRSVVIATRGRPVVAGARTAEERNGRDECGLLKAIVVSSVKRRIAVANNSSARVVDCAMTPCYQRNLDVGGQFFSHGPFTPAAGSRFIVAFFITHTR